MKTAAIVIVSIVLGLLLAWQLVRRLGAQLPEAHRAEVVVVVPADLPSVAARIRSVEAHPGWRRDLRSLTVDERTAQGTRYRETDGNGTIAYLMTEHATAPQFITEITDASLPFGGRWLYALYAVDAGSTRVKITEEGLVRDPVFRFLAKHVFGHDRTLRAYARDLVASFSATSTAQRAESPRQPQ